jgi:hypothetical protein
MAGEAVTVATPRPTVERKQAKMYFSSPNRMERTSKTVEEKELAESCVRLRLSFAQTALLASRCDLG